jgi:DUF3037 family protein
VRERFCFDYAIVRVVPRVERGEFVNAGVILFSSTAAYLRSRIELDRAKLHALAPGIDTADVDAYLDVIPRVCAGGAEAGPIGALPQRARFHWLVAPRSTIIQTSPMHTGVDHDLDAALERLFVNFVRTPE